MKNKQLTQTDVNLYMHGAFAKSRLYSGKLVNLEHGTYNIVPQVITIAVMDMKKKFDFSDEGFMNFIRLAIRQMQHLTLGQRLKLIEVFPHWKFFEDNIKPGDGIQVSAIHSSFKAAFPFEDKSLKNFYNKLRHWQIENGHHLNIKGGLFNKFLVVSK